MFLDVLPSFREKEVTPYFVRMGSHLLLKAIIMSYSRL